MLREGGWHYYYCCLDVESNNPGVAVLNELYKDYKNLYYRHDIITGKMTRHLGWLTTDASKTYMIKEFNNMLPSIITHDANFVRECRNLRYFGLKAMSVGEDDRLMAGMIAIAAKDTTPASESGYVGRHGWTW